MKIRFSKNYPAFILGVIFILSCEILQAQSAEQTLKNIPDNVKQNTATKASATTNSVSNGALDKIDSATNKAIKGITNLFKKKPKKPKTDSTTQQPIATDASTNKLNTTGDNNIIPPVNNSAVVSNPIANTPITNTPTNPTVALATYNNFDFRAGDKIIFEDEFVGDADGEFPSHWNLLEGQGVINKIEGVSAFALSSTPGMRSYSMVSPLMTKPTYLTSNFSVEFDQYLTSSNNVLNVFMYDNTGNVLGVGVFGDNAHYVVIKTAAAKDVTNSTALPLQGDSKLSNGLPVAIAGTNFYNSWHHIALAYKNDQLKVYVDQYRVLVVPHCGFSPTAIECRSNTYDAEKPVVFKNFKIADGAQMNMLGAIMTTGKFVTHGISFDVNKAVLKPESLGVIGDVVKQLQDNPTLNLEIDGYTDSDGDATANITLSQQRADAVKDALVQAGIDATRLVAKGFGAAKPIASNTSQQGKAENRRVEFIKM